MMLIGTHTMACGTLVGLRAIQSVVGAILGPHHLINTFHWFHCCSNDFDKGLAKCPPEKQTS